MAAPVTTHNDAKLGRTLRAAREFTADEILIDELSIVCGHCSAAGGHPNERSCGWLAVLQNSDLDGARGWHAELCARTPPEGEPGRANWIRVCCLHSIVVQAAADRTLFNWLMASLVPAFSPDDDHAVDGGDIEA